MVFETLKDFAIYDELKYLISVIFKKSIFIPLLWGIILFPLTTWIKIKYIGIIYLKLIIKYI